ncbi:MAG: hypothetical protein WBX27_14470 [Specibacter sp.]
MSSTRWHIVAGGLVAAALLGAGTACSSPVSGPISTSPVSAVSLPTSIATGARQAALSAPRIVKSPVPSATPSATAATGAIRHVHSPRAVDVDEQLVSGKCHAGVVNAASGDYLPDPSCTPGAVDPAVTEANIASTICHSGYTATVRPPASATDRFKVASLAAYWEVEDHTVELDHLVSLEIGGANSASNLWPELNRVGATGTTNPKDAVEDTLHAAVCDHKVTLLAAQKAIASSWITALHKLGL